MNDHLDPTFTKILYRSFKHRQRISSPDICRRPLMDRLQSKLNPYRLDVVQLTQKIQDFIPQTVRSCPDRQCYHSRMMDRLCKNLPEIFHRGVSIRICLKIRNVFVDRALGRKNCNLAVDLLRDRQCRICRKITASTLTAENTSPGTELPVTVRTRHPAVQSHLIYFFAKGLSQHIVK